MGAAEKTLGRDVGGTGLDSHLQAGQAYQEYRSALTAILRPPLPEIRPTR